MGCIPQPDRQRAGPAAEVEHHRVGAPRDLLDGVDDRGEPILPIRQVLLLLGVPPLYPTLSFVLVEHGLSVPAEAGALRVLRARQATG